MLDAVDSDGLGVLIEEASRSPRGRSHLLLHNDHNDSVQRFLIAGRPDTFIRPHRHSDQWEMLVAVRGEIDVFTLSNDRKVVKRQRLSASTPVAQVPAHLWHTVLFRGPMSVILEVKPGPFRPSEFAQWAPEEGTDEAETMLHMLVNAQSDTFI